MMIVDDLKQRNLSLYAQWLGILTMILCFALGIANVFTFHIFIIILAALCIFFSFIILFIEVPFLLRICPTSAKFDAVLSKIKTNWARAGAYAVMSVVLWLSLIDRATTLIVPAVFLAIIALLYLAAAALKQDFVASKTLGGQGVAQMIV